MDAILDKLFACADQSAPDSFLQRFHKLKTLKRVLPTSKQAFVRDVSSYFEGVENLNEVLDSFFEMDYDVVEQAIKSRQNPVAADAEAPKEAAEEAESEVQQEDTAMATEESKAEPQGMPTEEEEPKQEAEPASVETSRDEEMRPAEENNTEEVKEEVVAEKEERQEKGEKREHAHESSRDVKEEVKTTRDDEQANADAREQQEAMKEDEASAQPSTFTSSMKLETKKEGGLSQAVLTQHKTYNVWVGDLMADVTESDLMEAFKPIGGVKSVRCFKDRMTGKNRGFGFVHFTDRATQQLVLRADFDCPSIKGRRCRVGPSAERVTLYLGGLPESAVTEKVLEKLSEWIGSDNIASLEVKCTDEGRCRGFGFLQLTDQHTAYNCLRKLQNMPSTRIDDRNVNITWAEPDEDPSQANSKSVYVSNLDKALTEDEIRNACKVYGTVLKVTISKDTANNQPRGYCFVEFDRRNDALKAITALHNTKLGNNYIQASIAKPRGAARGGYNSGPPPRDVRSAANRDPYGHRGAPPPPPRREGRGGYHDNYASRPSRDYGSREGGYGGGYNDYGGRGGDYYRESRGGSYGGGYDNYDGGYGGYGGGYGGGYSSQGGYGGGYSSGGYGSSHGGYGGSGGYGSQGGYDGYSGGYDRSYSGGPHRSSSRGSGRGGSSRYNPY